MILPYPLFVVLEILRSRKSQERVIFRIFRIFLHTFSLGLLPGLDPAARDWRTWLLSGQMCRPPATIITYTYLLHSRLPLEGPVIQKFLWEFLTLFEKTFRLKQNFGIF